MALSQIAQVLTVYASLIGPIKPVEAPKMVYVLIDSTSKNQDVRHKSAVIKSELQQMGQYFPEEETYIGLYGKIIIEEYVDKYKICPVPSFKFYKNQDYQQFAPGTFAASGTFYLSLFSILKWRYYLHDIDRWLSMHQEIIGTNIKTGCEFGSQKGYWVKQPPHRPLLFPDNIFDLYGYRSEIYRGNDPACQGDISKPEVEGALFYWDYSDNNLWFYNVQDSSSDD